jgi:hypothetical protein
LASFKMHFQHLLGVKKNIGTVIRIADGWVEIRTWGFSNTKSDSVNYSLLCFIRRHKTACV